jgi:hypothetical protein
MARKAKKSAKRTSAKKRKKSPGMMASAMKTMRKGARKIGL